MAIHVEVTAEDIAKGTARDCYRCAVALAMNRAFGETSESHVYEMDFHTWLSTWHLNIRCPWVVFDFLRDFDGYTGDQPKPFTFELPDLASSEWEERCYSCENLFSPDALDDRGNCPDCKEPAQ